MDRLWSITRQLIEASVIGGARGWHEHNLGRFARTHHMSTNHQVQVADDTATSRSYLQAVHVPADGTEHWVTGGWYDCEYRRVDGSWRFTRVVLNMVWETGTAPAF